MLEIAKQVIRQEKNVCFLVAGDGPQNQELRQKIRQAGLDSWFVCTGEITEMEKVYADSDLTLICSLKEGLSLTAYESCAMATPVVSADVGGQKELIDETVGRLVPLYQKETDIDSRDFAQEEIDAYAAVILEVLQDPRQYAQLCRNCRQRIETGFSTDKMIVNLEKVLLETLDKVRASCQTDRFPKSMMGWAQHYLDTYLAYEAALNPQNSGEDLNLELKRIANSRLGRFAIKVLMKLKINKLFR